MYPRNHNLALVTISTVPMLAGCLGSWRPPTEHLTVTTRPAGPALADCLRASRLGRWVYERHDLPTREDEEPTSYMRWITPERICEGLLVWRTFLPIESYLDPSETPATQPQEDARPGGDGPRQDGPVWPKRPKAPWREREGMAVFFRLAKPIPPIPADLTGAEPLVSTTPVTYYNYDGNARIAGTLERRVQIEGCEDVECPAGRFPQCLRLRVDLNLDFSWTLHVELTTYVWMSPQVGEVRRVQSFCGWFLIFWFGTAHDYRLVSYHPPSTEPGTAVAPVPAWSSGALLIQGAFPHPRIAGMIVDLVNSP